MSSISDPLSKPEWPSIEPDLQDTLVNLLVAPCSRGTTDTQKFGFNATMQAIEDHFSGKSRVEVIFVARNDLDAAECLPLALASASGQIKLVTLPKGSRQKLNGNGVICFCSGADENQIKRLIAGVGHAKLDWVYQAAQGVKRNKQKKAGAK